MVSINEFFASLLNGQRPPQPIGETPNDIIMAALRGSPGSGMPRADSNSVTGGVLSPVGGIAAPPANAAPEPTSSQHRLAHDRLPEPSILERFAASGEGYRTGGLVGALTAPFIEPDRALQTKRQEIERNNATYRALVGKGLTADEALSVVTNKELSKEVIPSLFGKSSQTDLVKNYEYARGSGYSGSLVDFMRANKTTPDQETPETRAGNAQKYGLDANSDAGKAYILTGKLPREDQQMLTATDKKAILEADETVTATEGAITSLRRARELSKTAYDGATANERGWLMSQFGSQAANDTRELKQVVTEGALQQLKAIFGGMPTEGERKVLLEVQGSAEMPQEVREKIYDRAIGLAERRLAFNKQRAAELRGGTFYKPKGDTGDAPAPSGVGGAPVRARNAEGVTIEWDGKQWVPVR